MVKLWVSLAPSWSAHALQAVMCTPFQLGFFYEFLDFFVFTYQIDGCSPDNDSHLIPPVLSFGIDSIHKDHLLRGN